MAPQGRRRGCLNDETEKGHLAQAVSLASHALPFEGLPRCPIAQGVKRPGGTIDPIDRRDQRIALCDGETFSFLIREERQTKSSRNV